MNRDDLFREICDRFNRVAETLNERQRRLWAAEEAIRLGHGGITLVSKALRISPNTIKKGMLEIAAGEADPRSTAEGRIRKPGGGRKRKEA